MNELIAFLTIRWMILTDTENRDKGASATEYVLMVVLALALAAIVTAAVTAYVQNKANMIQ